MFGSLSWVQHSQLPSSSYLVTRQPLGSKVLFKQKTCISDEACFETVNRLCTQLVPRRCCHSPLQQPAEIPMKAPQSCFLCTSKNHATEGLSLHSRVLPFALCLVSSLAGGRRFNKPPRSQLYTVSVSTRGTLASLRSLLIVLGHRGYSNSAIY